MKKYNKILYASQLSLLSLKPDIHDLIEPRHLYIRLQDRFAEATVCASLWPNWRKSCFPSI